MGFESSAAVCRRLMKRCEKGPVAGDTPGTHRVNDQEHNQARELLAQYGMCCSFTPGIVINVENTRIDTHSL